MSGMCWWCWRNYWAQRENVALERAEKAERERDEARAACARIKAMEEALRPFARAYSALAMIPGYGRESRLRRRKLQRVPLAWMAYAAAALEATT